MSGTEAGASKRRLDLIGHKYAYFMVLEKAPNRRSPSGTSMTYWKCQCICGNVCEVRTAPLRNLSEKSCGCRRYEGNTLPDFRGPKNRHFKMYKDAARHRNHSFELTQIEFENLTSQNCSYCGQEPELKSLGTKNKIAINGLDRIDNKKGYSLQNVVPCCGTCNLMKHTLGQSDFIGHILKIAKFNGGLI